MSFERWLTRQPEITRPIESDQRELIRAIEQVAEGPNVFFVPMGRGRGTTTILRLGAMWLAGFDLWAVVLVTRKPEARIKNGAGDRIEHNVGNVRGLTSRDGTKRPDIYLVDFERSKSVATNQRNLYLLQKIDIVRGVTVNVDIRSIIAELG